MDTPETNSPEKPEKTPEASQEVVQALLDLITELIGDSDYDGTAIRRLADESIVVTISAIDMSTKQELSTPESVQPLVTISINRTGYLDKTAEGQVDYEIVTTPGGQLKVIEPVVPNGRPYIVEDLLGLTQDESIEVLVQNEQRRTKEKLEAPGLGQREVEDLILDLTASVPAIPGGELA